MNTLDTDIDLLGHSRSPKRRSAAKRLRKSGDERAGPALLSALQREIRDPRTWETQYQMVMALGECNFKDALPFLIEFAGQSLDATMIYIGLGDALVRLQIQSLEDGRPIIALMNSNNDMLIDGAFRAMAMLKMVPSQEQIDAILKFVSAYPRDHEIRCWPLAACPEWTGDKVSNYIAECALSTRQNLKKSAQLAAAHKYRNWSPL